MGSANRRWKKIKEKARAQQASASAHRTGPSSVRAVAAQRLEPLFTPRSTKPLPSKQAMSLPLRHVVHAVLHRVRFEEFVRQSADLRS